MNQVNIPLSSITPAPANEINKLADELLMNFKVSGKNLSTKSWDILAEILDFVVEAEQTIADQSAQIEKLEVMTSTDPLTGLLNRRGIIREVEHAIATADRHGETALFVYIDLDMFKQVNDTFGHTVGDDVLQHVATVLLSSIRQTDYAARLGGDEFALLLCHTEFEGGIKRTRFIQQQLNFASFKHNRHIIPIKASFGVAEIKAGATLDNIIKTADQKMYENKLTRNCK